MPTATAAEKRPLIPSGDHLLVLICVEEKEYPSFNDPEKMEPRWSWQFKAKATDPETGERYDYRVYTGTRYGNPKATLTILLDQMLPDWTEEQKGSIDTDTILQTYYKARIRHEKPEKAGGDPKARLTFIEPYKPVKKGEVAAPAPEPLRAPQGVASVPDPEEDEDFDPFAKAGE